VDGRFRFVGHGQDRGRSAGSSSKYATAYLYAVHDHIRGRACLLVGSRARRIRSRGAAVDTQPDGRENGPQQAEAGLSSPRAAFLQSGGQEDWDRASITCSRSASDVRRRPRPAAGICDRALLRRSTHLRSGQLIRSWPALPWRSLGQWQAWPVVSPRPRWRHRCGGHEPGQLPAGRSLRAAPAGR